MTDHLPPPAAWLEPLAAELRGLGWTASVGFGFITATYLNDDDAVPELRVSDDGVPPTIRETGGGLLRGIELKPYVLEAIAAITRHMGDRP